nr:MAG TPA: hypothetical protein [Caudoviricetes sp.]
MIPRFNCHRGFYTFVHHLKHRSNIIRIVIGHHKHRRTLNFAFYCICSSRNGVSNILKSAFCSGSLAIIAQQTIRQENCSIVRFFFGFSGIFVSVNKIVRLIIGHVFNAIDFITNYRYLNILKTNICVVPLTVRPICGLIPVGYFLHRRCKVNALHYLIQILCKLNRNMIIFRELSYISVILFFFRSGICNRRGSINL